MLQEPRDIRIDVRRIERLEQLDDASEAIQIERLLRVVFGPYYVSRMRPSPLLRRIGRMKREVEAGHESFDRKLRYLLWLN